MIAPSTRLQLPLAALTKRAQHPNAVAVNPPLPTYGCADLSERDRLGQTSGDVAKLCMREEPQSKLSHPAGRRFESG
jgi:hypothetical protein